MIKKSETLSLKNAIEEGNGKPPQLFSQETTIQQNIGRREPASRQNHKERDYTLIFICNYLAKPA